MSLKPMFVDKFAVNYEHMEDRVAQDLTWHGLPIPEIAPKAATSQGPETSFCPREKVRKTAGMSRLKSPSSKAVSSGAHERSKGEALLSAPPMPMREDASTYERRRSGSSTLKVPSKPTTHIVRFSDPKEEVTRVRLAES